MFDDDTYTNDIIDHPTSVLDEYTHYPSEDYELTKVVISFSTNLLPSVSNSSKDSVLIKETFVKEISENSPLVKHTEAHPTNPEEHSKGQMELVHQ